MDNRSTYLERMKPFAIVAFDLEDTGRDIHSGAKYLGQKHVEQPKVTDPKGVGSVSPCLRVDIVRRFGKRM